MSGICVYLGARVDDRLSPEECIEERSAKALSERAEHARSACAAICFCPLLTDLCGGKDHLNGPHGHVVRFTLSAACHVPELRSHHTCNKDAKWTDQSIG